MIFMDLHEAGLLFGSVGLTTHWEDGTDGTLHFLMELCIF
jgi:hypothetical protein